MVRKHPISPNRIRRVPKRFSWVDHRLVRDQHIKKCSHPAAALYLFLLTVGDAKGLSFYSDSSIKNNLSMDDKMLQSARENLICAGLIAWESPLYQVLSLQPIFRKTSIQRAEGQLLPIADIFKQMKGDKS